MNCRSPRNKLIPQENNIFYTKGAYQPIDIAEHAGMFVDNEKLKVLLKSKIEKAPKQPTNAMYELVINSDVELMVRLVIVFGALTMSMVRKNFDEGLGAAIKKLTGGQKNEELVNK